MSTVANDGHETRCDIYNKSAVNRRSPSPGGAGRLGKSIIVTAGMTHRGKKVLRAMIVTSRPSLRTQIHLSHASRTLTVRYSWARPPKASVSQCSRNSPGLVFRSRESLPRRRRNNMSRGDGASWVPCIRSRCNVCAGRCRGWIRD